MTSPAAQWNLELATVLPFFVLVGAVSLVENVKVVFEPLDQSIEDVPLVEPVKRNVPVPGALGDGEQRLTETVPDTFPLNVPHVPLVGLGFGVFAEATPGTNTAITRPGTVSAVTSATTCLDRDRCMQIPLLIMAGVTSRQYDRRVRDH
jgi:hypothetical protein